MRVNRGFSGIREAPNAPDLGYTEGETEAEARRLIEDAIRLHVESRIARSEPIYQEVGSHRVLVAL